MAKALTKQDIRKLIINSYENILWELSQNEYSDEPMEAFPLEKTQEEKFDLLLEQLPLSLPVVEEIIKRYLEDQKITEKAHPKIKGIDTYKQAGYLTFWIVKLKPIMNLIEVPIESEFLINEQLALNVSSGLLYGKYGEDPPFSQKIIDDLKYTLRYRINTRHDIALIYESVCRCFDYLKEQK